MSAECAALVWNASTGKRDLVIALADDPERLNMEMATFSEADQSRMHIEFCNRWEDGD